MVHSVFLLRIFLLGQLEIVGYFGAEVIHGSPVSEAKWQKKNLLKFYFDHGETFAEIHVSEAPNGHNMALAGKLGASENWVHHTISCAVTYCRIEKHLLLGMQFKEAQSDFFNF